MSKTSKLLAAKNKISSAATTTPTREPEAKREMPETEVELPRPVLVGNSTLPPLPSEQDAAVAAETARVAAAAQAPAPALAKNNAPARVSTGGSRSKYTDLGIIHVMVSNPKRPGTAGYARFACYAVGMTVAQYKADRRVGKFAAADLNWDLSRGFIAIQEPGQPEPVRKTTVVAPETVVEGSGEVVESTVDAPATSDDGAQMAAD